MESRSAYPGQEVETVPSTFSPCTPGILRSVMFYGDGQVGPFLSYLLSLQSSSKQPHIDNII